MDALMCLLAAGMAMVALHTAEARQAESVPTELTRDEIKVLLDTHNANRRKVEPTGSNIRLLSWDDELAGRSQAYANKCVYTHSPPSIMEKFGFIGESLHIANYHGVDARNISAVVTAWCNEKNFYDFNTNVCDAGKECGHYRQAVWDDTYKVGCGMTMCNGTVKVESEDYHNPTIIVCKYGPAGNVKPLFSPTPRRPYKAGDWCSACPKEAPICVDRLCDDKSPVVQLASTTNESPQNEPEKTTKPSPQIKPNEKSLAKASRPETLKPQLKASPLQPPSAETGAQTTGPERITDSGTVSRPMSATSRGTVKKPVTFSAPYYGLQCYTCTGAQSTEECVKLNQTSKCRPENITSLEMLTLQDQQWSCARYKEESMVKMKCMLSSECETLKNSAEATCCEKDFCNNARKPEFARLASLIGLALMALIELQS